MLRSSSRRRLAWIVPLALIFLLTVYAPMPTYESLLVLADTAAGAGPSRLKATTPAPRRIPVAYEVAGRKHTGDIYLPGEGKPEAGIVLVPGAVPKGKDDARLVAFATTLARARFAVLAPEIPGFRQMQINPSDARKVADAFAYLASRTDIVPGARVGIGAFSYAVGPAVLAALQPDIREQVRFIVGVGGYHDFRRAVRYFTTGYFEDGGKWAYIKPDDYGKLVLVHSSMPYLSRPRDRDLLEAMVARKLKDIEADVSDLAAALGAEGRSVYDLVTIADPLRAQVLLDALPAPLF
ncbi:MAG: alpha/beta hydrolase, partial [Gammaproteobacteria bacterium]|nr:alpha/beta hydrolase [Gammaproteobacteria bacterium]